MGERIVYNIQIPNSGMHRPNRAMYGEYLYVPAQRWVHNLKCGGIAFLYHPCAHPRLKEELSLLAKACTSNHIITPHLNLSQERPLALVAWGKTLEMSEINLAEAEGWLRKSAIQAQASQVEGDGVYTFLLIQKAKPVLDNNGVICPADQMKKLQHYFKKKDLHSTAKKWNKVAVRSMRRLPNRHVILRRNVSSRILAPVNLSSEESAQKNKKDEDSSTNFAADLQEPTGHTMEQFQKALVRTSVSQGTKKGSHEIGATPKRTANESELKGADSHSLLSNHSVDPLKTDRIQLLSRWVKSFEMHNTSHSSWNIRVKTQQGEFGKDGNRVELKEQEMAKTIAKTLSDADGKGLNGNKGQVNENGTLVSEQNVQVSSKNDDRMQNGNFNKSDSRESERVMQEEEMEINATLARQGWDTHNVTAAKPGSIKCKCDGTLKNVQVDSDSKDTNGLMEEIVKVSPDNRIIYVPTPRTEEAGWAAAALTFLFVLLTFAVLYTRLYKRFIKSESLYWTPVLAVHGQENVADIIKRRIIRLSKKRKKRKKKSIPPYEVLPSDNSD
ncbi:tumor protein p53-inducible protein 13 isoform X2 [Narcine bancroftii]